MAIMPKRCGPVRMKAAGAAPSRSGTSEFKDLARRRRTGPRNIRIAPRRLRRFAREGAAEELDLDVRMRSAADKDYIDVQCRPERRSAVKVLLFLGVGGSMDWHGQQPSNFSPPPRA